MQELMPVLWDDLELHSCGGRISASHTVRLGLNGRWAELDLNESNYSRLMEYLGEYMEAGRRPVGQVRDTEAGRKIIKGREYNRGIREFADARGISYTTASGKWYYSRDLRRAYEEHLADSGNGDPE
jgi:hypothetical protein